ncbi:MAG: hypothetical protein ACOH2E_05425 [Candidatus Paracaedibacter sp.]
MKIAQLKNLSFAYAMALCCQPILGVENHNQFPAFNSTPQEKQKREKQETKKLTLIEMNVHKMLLMKEPMNNMEVPMEVSNIITRNLHDVTHINPVLDGKLIFTPDNGGKTTFEIKNLLKTNDCIDLSNKIFGQVSKYLLITTDLEQFFSIKKKSSMLVMLIAPRFLIEEETWSLTKPFEKIMNNWKEDQAPIGIFWRIERWKNLDWYWYLTSNNLTQISKNNFYNLFNLATSTTPPEHATHREIPVYLMTRLLIHVEHGNCAFILHL